MSSKLILLWRYLIVSWLVFFFTSSGWTMWLSRLFGYGSLFVMVGAIITFRFLKNIPKSEKISYKPLIIVQLLAILFNYGDCGDASGSFNFFERILLMNGWNIIGEPCQSPYLDQVFFEGFARAISNICFLVFFIFLVVFLVKQTQRK